GAKSPDEGLKLIAEQVAQGIRERELGDKITFRVADPACWKVDGGPSVAERMAKPPHQVFMRPADNSRLAGWDQLRARLVGDEDSGPMIYWFDTCVDSIRTIPALQHDDHRPEDVDSGGEDHAGDQARYAVMA